MRSNLHNLLSGAAIAYAIADEGEPIGIMTFDQNLADVEKPPELPPGAYVGEVQDVQVQTSGRGNQYFAIKFVISPDEIPADLAEHYDEGATMYWNRQILPNGRDRRALFNMRKLIEALGLDANTTSIDPNDWMGQKARLRVVHTKYQGENRAEIKSLEPAEVAAPRPAKRSSKK